MIDGAPERITSRIWPEPMSGCWLWSGALKDSGYGVFGDGRRTVLVHRWVLEQVGRTPGRLLVRRSCDNRACCNPDHLTLGTSRDNYDDMRRRGREKAPPVNRGERHPHAKLTRAQAEWAIEQRANGVRLRTIANDLGVTHSCIKKLVRGATWKDLQR